MKVKYSFCPEKKCDGDVFVYADTCWIVIEQSVVETFADCNVIKIAARDIPDLIRALQALSPTKT